MFHDFMDILAMQGYVSRCIATHHITLGCVLGYAFSQVTQYVTPHVRRFVASSHSSSVSDFRVCGSSGVHPPGMSRGRA